jgi:cyclopropane fatty-acyl-phospholipid synthase-like methyltransferase
MTAHRSSRIQADYGIDGPGAVAGLLIAGGLCLAAAGGMFWSSKVGKLRARDTLIGTISCRGDEMVLDVGCGRGLLLIAAAKRLTAGKAIGIDLWHSVDQAGNRPQATWANARLEGVADRIDIKDADARQISFADGTFDVIVSSLVLHNIHGRAERDTAVREIVRVLKPGGRVALLDIAHTKAYAQVLVDSGLADVRRSRPQLLFFAPARIVTGQKPSPSGG